MMPFIWSIIQAIHCLDALQDIPPGVMLSNVDLRLAALPEVSPNIGWRPYADFTLRGEWCLVLQSLSDVFEWKALQEGTTDIPCL